MGDRRVWCVLTGEYPPAPGGIADYTRNVARALATAGDEVHVWAPRSEGPAVDDPGVCVHRTPGALLPGRLGGLDALLRARPEAVLLVQYAPHALGLRALNLPLCAWLARPRRARRMWVMFHEVCFPWQGPPRHRALAGVTRVMAALLASSAARRFSSIERWCGLIRRLDLRRRPVCWSPIPSNLPLEPPAELVAEARRSLGAGLLVGHFGTYGGWFRERLRDLAPRVTNGRDARLVLLGRGAVAAAEELLQSARRLQGRVVGSPGQESAHVAAALAACDVLLQPYPDGVSARRTTAMAVLALGRPLVTNRGPLTDSVWSSDAVALAPTLEALPSVLEDLLERPAEHDALGRRGASLYRQRFSIDHTIETLRRPGATP